MAEVWRARMSGPAGFARIVVIKRVLPEFLHEEAFVRMFVEEARVSAQLNHTNIVQVFELGDMDGEYFLAMEYLRGRDLSRVAADEGPLPLSRVADVLRQTLGALEEARKHGLIPA